MKTTISSILFTFILIFALTSPLSAQEEDVQKTDKIKNISLEEQITYANGQPDTLAFFNLCSKMHTSAK